MQTASITAKDPGQNPVMTRSYQYSPAGNITNKNTEHGNYTYQYDELYRLTQATNPTLANEAYTYDATGNRLTTNNTTGMWSYNANNELLGYDEVSYQHDDNGNMTQKSIAGQNVNCIYDVEDRLVRVEDGSSSVIADYYYDPFGRRLWKEVDGTKTYFLYSDEGLIGEYDLTGQEIKTYGYAPDSLWSTNPLFLKQNSQYYFYQTDHLGTPQKLTSINGAVAWAATYTSFGEATVDAFSTVTNNLRFAGQYYDAEIGLYYNFNRYYDPTIGRYLRTDPYGEGLNLYAYCFNNPLIYIDPYGLCTVKKAWNWWSESVQIDVDGLALSINIGMGLGNNDQRSSADTYGIGFYVGAEETGYAELGGFAYRQPTQIGGMKEGQLGFKGGAAIDLTWYYGAEAEQVFDEESDVSVLTWGPFAVSKYYDEQGRQIATSVSVYPLLGAGFSFEKGKCKSKIFFRLQ